MEDVFIKIGQGKGNGEMTETIYRMEKQEKTLLDNFMYVRNNGLNIRSLQILLIAGSRVGNQQLRHINK